jgi:hypothetical protein
VPDLFNCGYVDQILTFGALISRFLSVLSRSSAFRASSEIRYSFAAISSPHRDNQLDSR